LSGEKSRGMGARFEKEVREDLEKNGWTVSRYMNNVDLESKKVIPAKFNRFNRNTGFCDFIAFHNIMTNTHVFQKIVLVECKLNGYVKPDDRAKIKVIQDLGFEVWVASKKNGKIVYELPE
jgi:hypothetical protein